MEEKKIEDMTIAQIKELKRQLRDEFKDLINEFFKNHPMVNHVEFGHVETYILLSSDAVTDIGLHGDNGISLIRNHALA